MNSERTSTNTKLKQRTQLKKRHISIKDDNTQYKRGVEQRYGKP
jgi:hypothetical protein